MKFTLLLITVSAVLSSVCAFDSRSLNTNALRLARGLSPLPPLRRATGVMAAKRSKPSSKPDKGDINNSCNTGSMHCCNSVTHADENFASILSGLLGIVVPANTAVGYTCHPMTAVGVGGHHCTQQAVCCKDNKMNGLVVVGCSPINISD